VRLGQTAQQVEVLFDEEGQIVVEGSFITAVVKTLVIENKGDTPILVCAGTLVTGGQQDRQIGQDFVIAAGETVPVDAYCVEPSRWHAREGQDGAVFQIVENIAIHGARSGGQYEGDQAKVWAAVRQTLADANVESGTQTLMDALQNSGDELKARCEQFESTVRAHFESLASSDVAPVGFAYAIDGEPVTVRSFAHSRIFEGQLPAFIRAMSFEAALAGAAGDREAIDPPTADAVVAMVERIEAQREEVRETPAANFNSYKEATVGFGSACFVRVPDASGDDETATEVVRLSQDWTARR
jgi:hypothetical protein